MNDYNVTEKLRPFSLSYAVGQMMHRSVKRNGSRESYHHTATKEAFARRIAATSGPMRVHAEDTTTSMVWAVNLAELRPVVECAWPDGIAVPDVTAYYIEHGRYPRRIFDIGLVDTKGNVAGAFEIVFTNSITDAKATDIREAGIFCFTVAAACTDRPASHAVIATTYYVPGACPRVCLSTCHSSIREDHE